MTQFLAIFVIRKYKQETDVQKSKTVHVKPTLKFSNIVSAGLKPRKSIMSKN